MIDAAIVGLGWWGRQHVESVQGKSERIRYVRGMTRDSGKARDFAAEHDLLLTTEYDDVLADPAVTAVVLATPHSLHSEQIAAAAAAGKHVFCEKPLALRKRDAEASVAVCARAGVALGVGQNRRFWPAQVEIRRMAAADELGTIMLVDGNYSHDILADMPPGHWRTVADEAPAAGMTGMGIHLTDAYIDLLGPVAEVTAYCVDRVLGRDAGDTIAVLLKFADGTVATIGTTFLTAYIWRMQVYGSEGWVETRGENELTVCMRGGAPETRTLAPVDSVLAEMDAFADTIENNVPYPIPAEHIVHNVAVLEAVIESARTGRPVAVG